MLLGLLACTSTPDSAVYQDQLTTSALGGVAQAIVDLGPRPPGTPAEEEIAALTEAWLREAGLQDVVAEPYTWDAWQRGTSSVSFPGGTERAWAWSPSPSGSVTGELVLLNEDVDGRIALSRSNQVSRAEAFASAWLGGAIGLVHVSQDVDLDGTDLVEVGHTLDGSRLPAAAVPRSVGQALNEARGGEVTLDITSTTLVDHESVNVLGRIPGTGTGRVYVLAHMDSWDTSESAFDDALGLAALVLLAREAAQHPPPRRELVFLATSGEEQGLQGAQAWVAAHLDEVRASTVALTLDVLWSSGGSFWIGASQDSYRELAMQAALNEGLEPADGGQPGLGSDHFPFMGEGLDAIWCTRQPDARYHTVNDTLDRIDLALAAAAVRSQWAVIAELAEVPR